MLYTRLTLLHYVEFHTMLGLKDMTYYLLSYCFSAGNYCTCYSSFVRGSNNIRGITIRNGYEIAMIGSLCQPERRYIFARRGACLHDNDCISVSTNDIFKHHKYCNKYGTHRNKNHYECFNDLLMYIIYPKRQN